MEHLLERWFELEVVVEGLGRLSRPGRLEVKDRLGKQDRLMVMMR